MCRLLAGCYTLCYSFGRERVHSASHSVDESVLIDLVNTSRTPLTATGWMALPALSRWRHGFESRTGCETPAQGLCTT